MKAICFMGAWHTRDNSKDWNFVKEIRKKLNNILSIEIMYKRSMRTIKNENKFQTISIDDSVDTKKYRMYGKLGINKTNSLEGVLILENCEELKMF